MGVRVEPARHRVPLGGDHLLAQPAEAVAHFVGVQVFNVLQPDFVQTAHVRRQPFRLSKRESAE
jgi:hypothetical protein